MAGLPGVGTSTCPPPKKVGLSSVSCGWTLEPDIRPHVVPVSRLKPPSLIVPASVVPATEQPSATIECWRVRVPSSVVSSASPV